MRDVKSPNVYVQQLKLDLDRYVNKRKSKLMMARLVPVSTKWKVIVLETLMGQGVGGFESIKNQETSPCLQFA